MTILRWGDVVRATRRLKPAEVELALSVSSCREQVAEGALDKRGVVCSILTGALHEGVLMIYRRVMWALAAALVAAVVPVQGHADPSVPPGQPVKCLTNSPKNRSWFPAICSTPEPTFRRDTVALRRSSSTRKMWPTGVAKARALEPRPRVLHLRRARPVRRAQPARRVRRARRLRVLRPQQVQQPRRVQAADREGVFHQVARQNLVNRCLSPLSAPSGRVCGCPGDRSRSTGSPP